MYAWFGLPLIFSNGSTATDLRSISATAGSAGCRAVTQNVIAVTSTGVATRASIHVVFRSAPTGSETSSRPSTGAISRYPFFGMVSIYSCRPSSPASASRSSPIHRYTELSVTILPAQRSSSISSELATCPGRFARYISNSMTLGRRFLVKGPCLMRSSSGSTSQSPTLNDASLFIPVESLSTYLDASFSKFRTNALRCLTRSAPRPLL